ncbi:Hsp70 family protein [Crocinitomicaceae bacterium]|nr:Hsp70 family protein [Crocinitomicaceae bacterium]
MSINWTNFLSESNKIKLESGDLNSDSTYVGIDFGTSTTVVSIASIDKKGELKVDHIPLEQKLFNGRKVIDYRVNSCVAFFKGEKGKKDKVLIGKGAKEQERKLKRGVNYWKSFKMELGTDQGCAYPQSQLNGVNDVRVENPEDVTILFFRYLKHLIESFVKEKKLPSLLKYTVTIPASFEANQRFQLMKCFESANIGIENSCLIDEPNAAFLSYFFDGNKNKFHVPEEYWPKILVFDFGAGTCDISILEIGETYRGLNVKNVSVSQYTEIGGDNIDSTIASDYLLNQMLNQSGFQKQDFRAKEINDEILPQLIPFAEKLKIEFADRIERNPEIINLSDAEQKKQISHIDKTKKIRTRLGELHIEKPTINLSQFIEVSNRFCFDTDFSEIGVSNNPLFSALSKAKIGPEDIDYILFIGGSSKNIIVQNQIKKALKSATVLLPRDLQSHVSKGAAIHSLLKNEFDTQIIKPISNQRIFTLIRENDIEKELTIVKAGIEVPFMAKEIDQFRPQREGQQVIEIPLFLGDQGNELARIILNTDTREGFCLNDNIKLTFEIDVNKVLIMKASLNDIETQIDVENPFSAGSKTFKEKEIQKALKDFNIATRKHGGTPPMKSYKVMVEVYKKNKDYINAADLLEEGSEKHNEKEYNALNILYSEAGVQSKSEHYAELDALNSPNSATALFNLANKYRFKNPKNAIEYLRKTIKIEPRKPSALYLLGTLLKNEEGEGLIKKSFDIFSDRYSNNRMNSWDYSWFSSCAEHIGDYDLAREIRRSSLEQNNDKFYNDENLMSDKT